MPELNGPPTTTRTSRHAARQQLGQRRLVEQRVAAGEQQEVEVGVRERVDAHLPVVDAEAVALDGALGLEARKRGNRHRPSPRETLRLGVAMRVARDVVDEHEVDACKRKPLQAVLDTTQRAVERIVPALHEWQDADVASGSAAHPDQRSSGGRPSSTAGNRRAVPRAMRHRSGARQAVAVMRRRIEIADTAVIGGAHECHGGFVHDRGKEVAERRTAEAERGVVDLHW